MVVPIVIYGSSVLRQRSNDLEGNYDIVLLADNMKETLRNARGLGLAAPQVGLLKNIFIIDTSPFEDEGIEQIQKAYINPEILNFGDDHIYFNEGCLSIPEIFEDVYRPEKIEVRYRDEQFNQHEEVLDGLIARIYQHEYDHLEGILFIDRLSALRRKLIRGKLNHLKRTTKR
jgi:peptide deformylase